MTTVKNEVFISLLHEDFYLVGRELTFGGERNGSRCGVIIPYLPYIYVYIYSLLVSKTSS